MKKGGSRKKWELKQPLVFLFAYILVSVLMPIAIKFFVFENPAYSMLSNEGWASFLGSYVGGVLGGVGTLLTMYLTLKNTIELQRQNKEETDLQIEAGNRKRDEEYKRDQKVREEERKEEEIIREREIRRTFADDIANLLGRYIADISKYHFASVFSQMHHDDKNMAWGQYEQCCNELEGLYRRLEKDDVQEEREKLTAQIKCKELELEKKKVHYEEMKKICDDNSQRANRIVANEALFTMDTKLQDIEAAEDFLKYLHEVHLKSSGNQDRNANTQVGDWLGSATKELEKHYADFRNKYVA